MTRGDEEEDMERKSGNEKRQERTDTRARERGRLVVGGG